MKTYTMKTIFRHDVTLDCHLNDLEEITPEDFLTLHDILTKQGFITYTDKTGNFYFKKTGNDNYTTFVIVEGIAAA